MTDRISLFIDGPNQHAAARALGYTVDFRKLQDSFRAQGRLVRSCYYTTVMQESEDDFVSAQPILDWLAYNGFCVTARNVRSSRGDAHVDLAVDALDLARSGKIDRIVLFSGDGDFVPLVAALQRIGVKVDVVSTMKTPTAMASDDLRRQADEFTELEALLAAGMGRPLQPRVATVQSAS